MATIALETVPDDVVERLNRLAAEHGSNVVAEALQCLEKGLSEREQIEQELQEIRALRGDMKGPGLTDEMIRSARREGRA